MLGAVVVSWFVWESERGSFKIGRPRSRAWKILDVDGQGVGGSWKLDNFHGRLMCIVPIVFNSN